MHEHASDTPESRELIAELEFVWEQVKSNSLPSSSSSRNRELRIGQDQQQDLRPSYTSLGGAGSTDARGNTGVRILKPISDGDMEEGGDSEDLDEGPKNSRQPYDLRNHKWRKRIEITLIRMTAEIAALKEQMEAGRSRGSGQSGMWAWLTWLVWSSVKHIVVDALILAIYVAWSKKNDRTLGQQLQMIVNAANRKAKTLQLQRLVRSSHKDQG